MNALEMCQQCAAAKRSEMADSAPWDADKMYNMPFECAYESQHTTCRHF